MPRPVNPTLEEVWKQAAAKRNDGGIKLEGTPERLASLRFNLYKYRKRLEDSPFKDVLMGLSIYKGERDTEIEIRSANSDYSDVRIVG